MAKFSKARKYIRLDGWRGYYQPRFAIAGASDTGSWSDSPCPSNPVKKELGALARVLRKLGHSIAMTRAGTSNAFCGKRWLIVPPEQHEAALKAVEATWRRSRPDTSTRLIDNDGPWERTTKIL